MGLAGIELRYLVDNISEQVQGYYISNIYGITKDSILFKLHHTEKSDLFMMISTSGVWLTTVKIDQMEPNRLLKRLSSDKELRKKQGLVANFAIISKNLFLDNLFFDILKIPFPYMKLVIKN